MTAGLWYGTVSDKIRYGRVSDTIRYGIGCNLHCQFASVANATVANAPMANGPMPNAKMGIFVAFSGNVALITYTQRDLASNIEGHRSSIFAPSHVPTR